MTELRTSEVLNRAADLIEERGWGTGPASASLLNANASGLCLEGGIAAAAGIEQIDIGIVDTEYAPNRTDLLNCPAYRAVQDYLSIPGSLWIFNDKHDRTASEVIETLRAAALIESSREARDDQETAYATYAENLAAVA